MAKLLIVMMCLLSGYCQDQQSRITLHMDSTIPDQLGGAKDIPLSATIQKTVDSIFCHASPGASFNVRLDPSTGNMEIVEDIQAADTAAKGMSSCMPTEKAEQCTSVHVCTPGSSCKVNLTVDCAQSLGPAKWEKIPQIEVSFLNRHGELVLQGCNVMCHDGGFVDDSPDLGHQGLSDLAIGLIIAGTIVAGSLLVIGFVVWKIKDMKRVEHPDRNIHHHIHYVSK